MPARQLRRRMSGGGSDAVAMLLSACTPNPRRTIRTTAKWQLIIGPVPLSLRHRWSLADLYELREAFPEVGPRSWLGRRIEELEEQCHDE